MFCMKCGKSIEDDARFCPNCGFSFGAPAVTSTAVQRDECLMDLYNNLRRERTSWKIAGIVSVIYGGFICALSMLYFIIGILSGTSFDEAVGLVFVPIALVYLFLGLLVISIGVLNFVMVRRTQYYIDTVYTDCSLATERCGNVGMLIFTYFFNNVAMIFTIINFARVKTNRATFEEIARLQREYRN